MSLTKILCSILIIVSSSVLVENRSYNNGLIFYNPEDHNAYLPPTISVSRGRGLAKFKYSSRGSIWSTFGKPCDCSGPLCGCCVGIKVKQFNFDQKMCANVSYISPKEEIQLEVFLNDTSTAKYGVAARNPSPLCVPIMMGIPMSMCIQMSNIGIQGDNLNMCMDFLVRLASTELFEMHFQCMKMGLQGVGWVGADGQPVIPANEGKIKDRSGDESDEYYDEIEDEKENEVLSKEKVEKDILKEKLQENIRGDDDTNKAEEEMDYNDITEKIMDIVKEKEEELKESSKNKGNSENNENKDDVKAGDNEIEKLLEEDINKNQIDLKADESKIESHDIIKKTANEQEGEKQADEFVIITEDIKPQETTLSEEYSDNSKESQEHNFANYGNIMQTLPQLSTQEEISAENYGNLMHTISSTVENEKDFQPDTEDITEITTASEVEKEKTTENTEKLHNDDEVSSEYQKFEMLTNNEEGTTELMKNESELKNSTEILNNPVDTTTEQFMEANLKPTTATAMTTSETNNVDTIDNSITTATIMTTMTTTMKTMAIEKDQDNDVATNLYENSNNSNNNNNSNDSDNSLENDSDYDDEEESEEDEINEDNEQRIKNEKTTTAVNINAITSNNDIEENANNEEKDHKETTTTKEISTATSSEESNSNDTNNHNEDNDAEEEDDEVEDNDDSDESKEDDEYEENEIETTTITDANNISDKTLIPSSLNKINTTINAATNDNLLSTTNNPQLTATDTTTTTTIDVSSSNNSPLSSSDSTTFANDSGSIIVNSTSNNMSKITATVVPLPLARKLFTPHRQQRRYYRQQH